MCIRDRKSSQETLEKKSEELKKQIKKDLEIVNKKIENNNDTLQRKLKEDSEKTKEELKQQLVEYREAVSYTHLDVYKRQRQYLAYNIIKIHNINQKTNTQMYMLTNY